MFRRTARVLVAVSGGADSVACLLVLLQLRGQFGFEVVAAHFDHQLRPESAASLAHVRDLCAHLDVPCFTGEGDVGAAARGARTGVEETARRMRYQFLAFIAEKERADCVATGHTADDQAETVLMHILRGSGIRGIRGMLPVATVPGGGALRLVRPLLCLPRSETRAICDEAGIEPLHDPSNDDLTLTRNRLRHETLVALRAVNPSVGEALQRLARSAREVFDGVERQAMSVQPAERLPIGAIFDRASVAALPNEARLLVIEREAAFFHLQPEPNATRLQNLGSVLARGTGFVRFGDTLVEVSSGKVRIGPPLEEANPLPPKILDVPGVTVAGPWRIVVATASPRTQPGALTAVVSQGTLQGAIRVRALQTGDRMRYHGSSRKVSQVLADAKVPAWSRMGAVALADSEGVVALFTSAGVIADPASGDDALYIQVGPAGR